MLDKENKSQPYHHGNVKEALIDIAMKLIESNEVQLLSLRRLAKEVGITPSAVYNHFSDKNALMLAIKIRLYDEFNKFFENRSSKSDDPEQGLLEICLAYYHFSQEYPSRFHFLFSSILPMEWSTPEMVEISCRTLVKTRGLVLNIYDKYKVPCSEEDVVNTTLLIWAQLHGIVALKKSGSIKAAIVYQDWPEACSMVSHEQVEGLIRNHLKMTINAILNIQHADSHH
ncbi:MAG: TetR/AcrR family transcriptional regulator [Gammaproteobacteria bacterium]|nr:TetR/AcrR family transcriptional regulator [Gammaproteobacteria bacterium]MDD9894899.1 TetR/AcrR family transcriptional regulator [Gammaproteobacteria bacterium]MDD9958846.1 TetR/AcrR family transcriptional regulator [Gammaproteobacteria bacterium]